MVFFSPDISIVIAAYNAGPTIARCLDSFLSCDQGSLEIIIKDGGSTDVTQSIAETYTGRLPIRVIKQPDTGIYDAWNQALEHAKGPQGRWVLFLGADDFICLSAHWAAAVMALRALPDSIDYASAPVTLVNEQGFAVDTLFPSRDLEHDLPSGMPLPHQGLFHRRRLFTANRFDASLRITGDYDFLCRTLASDNLTYLDIPAPVCMSLGGVSGNLAGMVKRNREALYVSRRFFSGRSRRALWKRLFLSYAFNLLSKVCGAGLALACADFYRKLSGKPSVWVSHLSLQSAMRLPSSELDGSKRPMFSLLIATINRKEPLQRLLESLQQQVLPTDAFEVLIADQNPPGFLEPIIDAYTQSLRIRVLQIPNKGVSHARNALLPFATGKYVAFPDDDCCYEPDTLHGVQDFFATHLHVHVIQASWSAPGCRRNAVVPANSLATRYSIFKRGETYVQFFRKEAVDRIGPFDPIIGPGTGLPYGCGEDTDYLLRAIEAGLPVMHVPSVHVRHNEVDVVAAKGNIQKISSYAVGRMYLLHKHDLPLWFQLLNIAYPLLRIPVEGFAASQYRMAMFRARLKGFFSVRFGVSAKT